MAFLDINISVDDNRQFKCGWYEKPTDTGTLLNFRSFAPLQHKRNTLEGTVHRIFRSTSTCEFYHRAILIKRNQWTEKHYTEEWSSKVESETLSKTLGANLIPTKTETRATDDKRGEKPQCSCFNFEEIKINCLQTRCAASPTNKEIKTRNLKTTLPSLKAPFSRDLNSNVVYKLSFCVCNSAYVGHYVRNSATRIEEHKREDSPVGIHIRQCGEETTSAHLNWEIID